MVYGVYGRNGAGIYFSWERVQESQPYIIGMKCKKFHNMDEAVDFIEYGLSHFYRVVPKNKRLNTELLYEKKNFFSYLTDLIA